MSVISYSYLERKKPKEHASRIVLARTHQLQLCRIKESRELLLSASTNS
jgi:hypothetical protein